MNFALKFNISKEIDCARINEGLTIDFCFFVQYNASTGQKQPILSSRSKIICKIA